MSDTEDQIVEGNVYESVSGDWWKVVSRPVPGMQVHCVRVRSTFEDGVEDKQVLWHYQQLLRFRKME